MSFRGTLAVQAAFVAIASRLVGATFRVWETYDPKIRQAQLVSRPEVVAKREAITLGLAWLFALGTNILIRPLAQRRGWNPALLTFMTTMIGTIAAESVGRFVAYKKALASPSVNPATPVATVSQGKSTVRHHPDCAFNTFAHRPLHNMRTSLSSPAV